MSYFIRTGEMPEELIDFNIASDYSKISSLYKPGTGKTKEIITDSILQEGKVTGLLTKEYSLEKGLNQDDIVSLLFYLGMLTIGAAEKSEIKFVVPNYVIRTLYWKYFLDDLTKEKLIDIDITKIREYINALAYQGRPELFIREVVNVLKQLSNRDLMKFDEKYIKLVLILLLNLTNVYHINSEYEEGGGYADLLLMGYEPYEVKYNYIFEIKYIKKNECTEKEIEFKKNEARKQLKEKYLSDSKFVKHWGFTGYILIFSGTECILQERI